MVNYNCFLAHWRSAKDICSHELSVVVVVIVVIICDQFSYKHTKSRKVPSLHVVALSYNFTSTKVHFACTRKLSFETCFDSDRPQEHRQYDIGYDMGLNVRYATEVDCSCCTKQDKEYERLMESLNLEQGEICIHIMEWIQTKSEPLHIFIEGGAGVRKIHVAKAKYQSVERFYGAQPDEDTDKTHCIVLAPTGMSSYHVKGNTLCSGLHIDLNKAKPTPLGNSEKNTLHAKYFETKAFF